MGDKRTRHRREPACSRAGYTPVHIDDLRETMSLSPRVGPPISRVDFQPPIPNAHALRKGAPCELTPGRSDASENVRVGPSTVPLDVASRPTGVMMGSPAILLLCLFFGPSRPFSDAPRPARALVVADQADAASRPQEGASRPVEKSSARAHFPASAD